MYERASRTSETFTPPMVLVRSSAALRTRKVILAAGAVYALGSVLGIVTISTAVAAVKAGGNTGTGTFVLDATTPILAKAKAGLYTLRCIAAAANGGTFRLEDPDGVVLGDVAIAGGAGGTALEAEQIKGVLTDGATDFVVGDGWDITIAPAAQVNGMDRVRLATAASTDGSQEPSLVLPYPVDATAADQEVVVYESGDFNKEALVLGAGLTLAGVREGLRRRNVTFA